MVSRLRRHAFCSKGDRLNAAPPSQPQRQQHRRNWLSRKARRLGQRSIREGRAGGNVATGAISGPLGLLSDRSEEHTSELQSLMRNSYAVLCLKNKKPESTKSP